MIKEDLNKAIVDLTDSLIKPLIKRIDSLEKPNHDDDGEEVIELSDSENTAIEILKSQLDILPMDLLDSLSLPVLNGIAKMRKPLEEAILKKLTESQGNEMNPMRDLTDAKPIRKDYVADAFKVSVKPT